MEFKARALFSSHVAPAALAASAKTGRANAMACIFFEKRIQTLKIASKSKTQFEC